MSKKDALEVQVVHEFVASFNRAAPDFPLMFKGTLDKAISACWPKNCKTGETKKMLALYVQKGFGKGFSEFVTCLSSRRMKMILIESFVIWGWDIETPERLSQLAALVTAKLDEAVNEIVPELENEPFPKLYLLGKPHDAITLAHKISDHSSEDQMFLEVEATVSPMVMTSIDRLEPMNLRDKRKSSSARTDTLGDRIELRASSIAKQHRERRSHSGQMSTLGVPPEPPPGEKGVIVVRFTDHNTSHERRFFEDDTVDAVVNYLISIGYSPDAYRFMGKKSRTDIGKVNRELKLKDLQVGKSEIVAIESIPRNK